ncbi:MAG: CsgG/HfaB family protein [Melioribacteraceae bacterium]|nr:CsgG/HfaB family protein [Melioribacteraceae bacterium]
MPEPREKIVAAVYKFRDQTGQYKASAGGTSWSTAVTQGATSILLKALEESGWFIPIEREGLSNLLNERKIIRSSRATYNEGNDGDLLPPLLFAGVVLEGGIVSYETNILTGGVGAKYFGAGASSEYRQDRVTVYLRAISTSNGRILKTVYTTKTILSQLVDVGLFRFVDLKKLLEVETGYSYNEPPEMCVTEAIEKAVQGLIIEGIQDGMWALKDSSAMSSPTIANYYEEKKQAAEIDALGDNLTSLRRSWGLGFNVGGNKYEGDYGNARTKPAWGISFVKSLSNNLYLGIDYANGELANDRILF